MGFSRPEYWSGQPFPSPVDLPDLGIKPGSPALQADSLPTELPGKPSKLKDKIISSSQKGVSPLLYKDFFFLAHLVAVGLTFLMALDMKQAVTSALSFEYCCWDTRSVGLREMYPE